MTTDIDNLSAFTILWVDDDDNFRAYIHDELQRQGFTVLATNSSSEACELIRGGKVSLVLLDWDLQNVNPSADNPHTGSEVLRTCHEVNALLPVIVTSLAGRKDAMSESLFAGADSYLQKPFPPQLLCVHLRRWLARVKSEQNPFTQLAVGVFHKTNAVSHAYTRAVVEKVGSALQAAPKLGLSRQTVASHLGESASLTLTSTSPS